MRTAGSRLPTMRDVAEHLGVSRQLVSLVLRGAPGPSQESRTRILQAAQDLGYRPNASARLLRQRRTNSIGLMIEMRNPFEVRFTERFVSAAAEQGFSVVVGVHTAERSTDVVVSELIAQRVEAVVAFNPDPHAPALQDALARVPVVWLGEKAPGSAIDNVRVDEAGGLRQVVRRLVELGHERIAYVGGEGGTVGVDRAEAYRDAMSAAGLDAFTSVIASGFGEEDGAAAARAWVADDCADRPTALVACSDSNAVGILAVLAHEGVAVPQSVSVVGFDDSYVAALSYNALTSVRQDVEVTVDVALRIVVERLSDEPGSPSEVLTRTVLTERASTGPAPTR
ncbi:LacI family transcriptional regulator [Curtobacterium sp. PhB115]|nr:LacI family transcriptional regulator [Curtobacterium sp. PhB115]